MQPFLHFYSVLTVTVIVLLLLHYYPVSKPLFKSQDETIPQSNTSTTTPHKILSASKQFALNLQNGSAPKYKHPNPKIKGVPFWYFNPSSEKLNFSLDFKDEHFNITDKDGKRLKVILFWNDFHGLTDYGFGLGRKPFIEAGCPVNTCVITADRNRYPPSEVDALIWHLHSTDRSFPSVRYDHTRYIFWVMEPPVLIRGNLTLYKDIFNMTFTYRKDADIYYPHDKLFLRSRPLPVPSKPTNYAKGKTKMAAWFVSNCRSQFSGRNKLVATLQRWIPVDVYGKCGKFKCALTDQGNCSAMLERDYKFYLALENNLCKDYASYKMFRALRANVVPVVWGLANYSDLAPPKSFINAFDFPSAYELAKYLQYLNTNDTAYNEYFTWKRYYHDIHPWFVISKPYCDLCEKLHQEDLKHKSYDIDKWYRTDANCMWGSSDTTILKYIHTDENLQL